MGLAGCERERTDPYLAELRRRSRKIQRHIERETGKKLGEVEILVRSREELAEIVVSLMRESFARIENGPRGTELEAEARSSAEGAVEWASAQIDRKGRILFPDPGEERKGLFWFLAEFLPKSESARDPRILDLILLHELIHVHQHRFLESAAFHESARSRADILARRAVMEGHAELLARKIAPSLGLAELYETSYRDRFEPSPRITHEFIRADHRIAAADQGYAYIQGRKFIAAIVERLGYEPAMEQVFKDPPSLAEVSRPEEYPRPRKRSTWGPISEDLRRWLARERGEAELEVIALPMVREIAGDAAGEFREGYRLRVDLLDVVIDLLIAESEAGARALHLGWTRGIERLNALKVDAKWFGDLRETRSPDEWTAECFLAIGPNFVRRTVVREGRLVLDVQCQPDSALEQGAERLARRALKFLRSPKWRETWLEGKEDLLKSEDAGLRLAAVTRLETFVPDEDWEVRWLGRYYEAKDEEKSEEERIRLLMKAVEDPHPAAVTRGLRAFASLNLWTIPWPVLRKCLSHEEAAVRREAWRLTDNAIGWDLEGETMDAYLAEMVRSLAAAFEDKDAIVRVRAAEQLGGSLQEQPGVLALFRKALSDDHERVREIALVRLTVHGFHIPELAPDLIRLLPDHPANAAEALGNLYEAAEEALPHLREVMKGSDGRLEAAQAIWLISWDSEPLFELVRESTAEGRPEGIAALGEVGAEARPMVPEVEAALAHESRLIRRTAAKALGKIGGKQARNALRQRLKVEKDRKVRKTIREAQKGLKD
ncbi:MAG: HEAT repeat domain-containing protein [Planctomycetota bacterium]